jgi:hypothetical protein
MVKFYTLSSSAGLIRTNKFAEKKDAICVGSYRAEFLNLPVKIFAHDEAGDQECILVCNPDGSAEKPQGLGSEPQDLGNASMGVSNREAAHILLAAFDEEPVTTFRLRSSISESQVQALEKAAECDIGMVSAETFNAFTQDPKKVHQIETQLAAWSLELDDIVDASLKRNKAHAAAEAVETITAARKGHLAARASRLPELRVRASSRFGNDHKFMAHCEMGAAKEKDKKAPAIHVHVDGVKVGEAKDEIGAKKMIAEHAEKSFSKFLRKELG